MLEVMTPTRMKALAAKLFTLAMADDLDAIRELLDRTLGKPVPSDTLERIEKLEQLLADVLAQKQNTRSGTWS
jgi:hypothetical protein